MDTELKYLSPEWTAEVRARLEAELTPEKLNRVSTSMVSVYENCPDGKRRYFLISCVDGKIQDVSVSEQEPSHVDFRIVGDYEIFAKISRAELGSQRALMSGQLKLKGNMVQALRLASLADRINRVIATVPTEF